MKKGTFVYYGGSLRVRDEDGGYLLVPNRPYVLNLIGAKVRFNYSPNSIWALDVIVIDQEHIVE
jgi:hypothetical protein